MKTIGLKLQLWLVNLSIIAVISMMAIQFFRAEWLMVFIFFLFFVLLAFVKQMLHNDIKEKLEDNSLIKFDLTLEEEIQERDITSNSSRD